MTGRNSTKKVGFSLPEETVEEMRKTSRKTGLSQSRIVADLLDKCLPFFTEEGLKLPQEEAEEEMRKKYGRHPSQMSSLEEEISPRGRRKEDEEEMKVGAPEPDERVPADRVPDPTAILKDRKQPGKMIREAPVERNSRSHLYQTEPTGSAPVATAAARQAPPPQQWQRPWIPPEERPAQQQFIRAGGRPGYTGAPVPYAPGYTGPPIQQPVQAPPPQQMPAQQIPVQPRPSHLNDPYSIEMIPGTAPIPGGSQAPTAQSLLGGGASTGQSITSQNPNMMAARAALGPNWRARLRQQQAADRRDR